MGIIAVVGLFENIPACLLQSSMLFVKFHFDLAFNCANVAKMLHLCKSLGEVYTNIYVF